MRLVRGLCEACARLVRGLCESCETCVCVRLVHLEKFPLVARDKGEVGRDAGRGGGSGFVSPLTPSNRTLRSAPLALACAHILCCARRHTRMGETRQRTTSLGDKFGRQDWETSLGDQFGRPVWETSLGDQFGRPVWETSLGDKFGRAVLETSLGDQFGRPVWETSLGDKFENVLSSPFPFAERNSEFCSRLCFPHSFFWGPVYSSRIALSNCSLELLSRFALSNCSLDLLSPIALHYNLTSHSAAS